MLPLIVPNTPIPPRSRARCFADSPRRGEYGALGTRSAGVDKMNSSNSNTHVLENIGFLMYLNAHE